MKWTKRQRTLHKELVNKQSIFVRRDSPDYPSFCGLVNRGYAKRQPCGKEVVEFRPAAHNNDPAAPYGRCFHCGERLGSDGYIEHAPGVCFCGDNNGKCHTTFMENARRDE